MLDLTKTIAPKSDQLNADDLIGRTKTIKIRDMKGTSDPAQPISIYFEGDENKPYKPCKSMRRLLVTIWGANGQDYIGKSLTLYRDEEVSFGNVKVGGIRISHASDITEDKIISLTASKTKRIPYKVQVLKVEEKQELTLTHPLFEGIKKAIADGTRTVEQIQAKFIVSEEVLTQLKNK
jgi:hypothetical protein